MQQRPCHSCADGKQIAISHGTKEDGKSRIYTLPMQGRDTSLDHPDCSPATYTDGARMDGNLPIVPTGKAIMTFTLFQLKEEKKDS